MACTNLNYYGHELIRRLSFVCTVQSTWLPRMHARTHTKRHDTIENGPRGFLHDWGWLARAIARRACHHVCHHRHANALEVTARQPFREQCFPPHDLLQSWPRNGIEVRKRPAWATQAVVAAPPKSKLQHPRHHHPPQAIYQMASRLRFPCLPNSNKSW